MTSEEKIIRAALVVFMVFMLSAGISMLIQPALEARTFNKFNDGPNATYWDAVFAELRVDGK